MMSSGLEILQLQYLAFMPPITSSREESFKQGGGLDWLLASRVGDWLKRNTLDSCCFTAHGKQICSLQRD